MLKTWIKRSFIVGMGFGLLAPVISHAYGEAEVIQKYVGSNSLIPLIKPSWGNFILHTETLNKLYSQRAYRAIWVDANGSPTAMAQALRSILLSADRHGLNVSDYWDGDVENLFKAASANPRNWITFELAASEALIRYVTHLSVGRFDPMQIDDDIKFSAKTFQDYALLNTTVEYGPQSMGPSLDQHFVPKHPWYPDMVEMLFKLKELRKSGDWELLQPAGVTLEKGVKHKLVSKLRHRLKVLGYDVSDDGNELFDENFDTALKRYQEENRLSIDGMIGANSSMVLKNLNEPLDNRIKQVEINMEKMRWLPRDLESRHIFVNLATSEFYMGYGSNVVFKFRTINGQPFRRTPSLRNVLSFIIFNPDWTVPRSIAIKDKLQQIKDSIYTKRRVLKENQIATAKGNYKQIKPVPDFFRDHGYHLMAEGTENEVFLSDDELLSLTPRTFNYFIRQDPSPKNALGVVKFHLNNSWAIYLHDTNEREKFDLPERHLSSGCVRLAQPLDLAQELLKDQGYTKEYIADITRPGSSNYQPKLQVNLKEKMIVYMMNISASMTEGGAMRFVPDPYGQDKRIELAIKNYRAKGELF